MTNIKPLRGWQRTASGQFMTRHTSHPAVRVLVLLILTLPALQPLLRQDLTCGYDNVFHLWRAVQVDALWSQGVFFSRWAPDMAHGYGFPLFIFTSPGPSMVVAFLHRVGLTWSFALNATFALGIVLGGLFMLFLAEDLFGPFAGLVAAVGYVYAPFQAYDVFYRGSLWESFAWAFPPLVLWSIERWAVRKQRSGLIWGVLGLALMVLSHHLFAFLFAPLFSLWVVMSAYRERDWRVLGRGVLVGILGMGLTAFFWVPPLLERSYVQTDRLLGTWVFDYKFNFISFNHLLAFPRFADSLLVNDWPEKALGFIPVILATLSLIGWQKADKNRRWTIALLWIMVSGFAALTLSLSGFVWDNVPLLTYLQFPWRFLGPAAFCIALLAGAACAACQQFFKSNRQFLWLVAGFVSMLIFANLGWFYPRHCAPPDEISIRAMLQWEKMTDTLGTTAKGEYLPIWVKSMPYTSLVEEAYANGNDVQRLNPVSLPAGSRILDARFRAISDVVHIEAASAFRCQWLRFYFPGWQVKIDGLPVTTLPAPDSGLLTFDIPSGQHKVEVFFTETPVRWSADAVSVVMAVIFGVAVVRPRRVQMGKGYPSQAVEPSLGLVPFALVILLVKISYADWSGSPWQHTRLVENGLTGRIDLALQANFDNKAELLAVDHMPSTLMGDTDHELTLYWRAINPQDKDWQIGLNLVGAKGEIQHNIVLRPARWSRTPPPLREWPRDQYARMDYILDLPPGIPPGAYDLNVKLFDRESLVPASVLGSDGNPTGPELLLGSVTIEAPRKPFSLESLGIPGNKTPTTCGPLFLWSVTIDRTTTAPGDMVALRWVWEAVEQTEIDIKIPVRLLDDQGDVVWVWDKPIIASWWPTQLWSRGDRWVGTLGLRMPGSLETGRYRISAGESLCEKPGEIPIDVIAPERKWIVPASYTSTDAVFAETLALRGYRLEALRAHPGEELALSLAWQGLVQMDFSYRIFVHVMAEDGHLLVQNDGEPAVWARPTTGWAVGEIVLDDRPLTIPVDADPGHYTVVTGVYLEDGTRLRLADGGDKVVLGTLDIE